MQLTLPLGLVALAALGAGSWLAPDAEPSWPVATVSAVDVIRANGMRGCDITISLRNGGTQNLRVETESQVRAKPKISPSYGTWKRLWDSDQVVGGGKTWSNVVRLDFGCNYQRQYRFVTTYGGNQKAFTVPSSGGTTNTTISLGDVYTKFFD